MRTWLIVLLLFLAVPASAQSPASAPAPRAASAPADTLLKSLIGTPQIVGVTETGGARFLGRIVSGDHGLYIVETFHFAGPPKTTQITVAAEPARRKPHTRSYTVGHGRYRQRIREVTYTTVPARKPRTARVLTDTMIPDDEAVRLLLRGVAGPTLRPREIPGAREIVAARDIKYLQALSPPAGKGAKTAVVPFPGDPLLTSPFTTSAHPAWTLTMLWPTDATSDSGTKHGRKKKRQRKPSVAPAIAL